MGNRGPWIAGLVAALSGPYLLFDRGENQDRPKSTPGSTQFASRVLHDASREIWGASDSEKTSIGPAESSMPTPKAPEFLSESLSPPIPSLLRFDLTADQILATWPQALSLDNEFDGTSYRVRLVSGLHPGDLAGALTYSFNQNSQLVRIDFFGSTRDERPLAQYLGSEFGLVADRRRPGQFVSYERRRPVHFMIASRANEIGDVHDTWKKIDLELNQPGSRHGLSEATKLRLGL